MINNSDLILLTQKLLTQSNSEFENYNQIVRSFGVSIEVFTEPNQAKIMSEAWYSLDRFLNHMWL